MLVLFFLPGITAETLTGSTPILVYLTNPVSALLNTLLYGSGALLIREVVRRRGVGWTSVLLLGAAFGIFEEGLVVNTWANPWLPQVCRVVHGTPTGLCDYSRVGGISLAFAAQTTIFHAVISITVPIVLVELLFPRRATGPWLGRTAPYLFAACELLVLAFGVVSNIASFRQHGFSGPPAAPYLIELALLALLSVVALRIKPAAPTSYSVSALPPHPWVLRIFAFVVFGVLILLPDVLPSLRVPFPLELAATGMLAALCAWLMASWSRREGWSDRQRLALAAGALGFFLLIWDPILELAGSAGGATTHGTAVVALAYLIMLVVLTQRVGRRVRVQARLATEMATGSSVGEP
jgi:hypothetical protein